MKYLIAFFIALALAGCVTERAVLLNERGETLTCETYGYGLFPSMLASGKQDQCIADAERRGYRLKQSQEP